MSTTDPKSSPAVTGLPLIFLAQYVKDLSFENPSAPDSLRAGQQAPAMNIEIGLESSPKGAESEPGLYEVVLRLTAQAKRDGATVFIAEVSYAALVSLAKLPEGDHPFLLGVEVPRTLFPFARQILADLTTHGGYPPLYLTPIDFLALHRNRTQETKDASTPA